MTQRDFESPEAAIEGSGKRIETPSKEELAAAQERVNELERMLPADWVKRENELPAQIRSLNASAATKLRRVFALVDELGPLRGKLQACLGQGCSSCCKMNVSISSVEADLLEKVSGRRRRHFDGVIKHRLGEFSGVPCPFLGSHGQCQVYEARPLVCRLHGSYLDSPKWCAPEVVNLYEAPRIYCSGPDVAVAELTMAKKGACGDIRDFFPT